MKQFLTILKFELSDYLKSKAFIAITLIFIIAIGGVLSYPRIIGKEIETDENEPGVVEGITESLTTVDGTVAIIDNKSSDSANTEAIFKQALQCDIVFNKDDEESLRKKVESGEYYAGIIYSSPKEYTYIVKNVSLYDTTAAIVQETAVTKYRFDAVHMLGVSSDAISDIVSPVIKQNVVKTGVDQQDNFFFTYAITILLFMSIMLYGQFVATSVATEKSSRAMELLITTAKPTNMMFGKVFGAGISGLSQLFLVIASALFFFNLNKDYWGGNEIVSSVFNMPASTLVYTIIFFLLGFFLYSFIYGACGSLASRMEDVNTLVLPITFVSISAYMVVIFSVSSGNTDSALMKACSFIPFTSPMAMFVRITASEASSAEIAISIAILIATIIGIGYLSAAIYKLGVLLYGKPPKITELFKMLKTSK